MKNKDAYHYRVITLPEKLYSKRLEFETIKRIQGEGYRFVKREVTSNCSTCSRVVLKFEKE